MHPARPSDRNQNVTVRERVSSVPLSRSMVAYLFVGAAPLAVGAGLGIELGAGWGIAAAGGGMFLVGWLLGAE